MPHKLIVALFALLCVAQWSVPLWMIRDRDKVLSEGSLYRFRVYSMNTDALIEGRYLMLNFGKQSFYAQDAARYRFSENVYVNLMTDSAGFARWSDPLVTRPSGGDYLRLRLTYVTRDSAGEVHYVLPFERYYLEEKKAAAADSSLIRRLSSDSLPVHAVVRVLHGDAALQDLVVE